jgi:hypothetical protein
VFLGGFVLNAELAAVRAKAKRMAAIANLMRMIFAGLTACGMLKGAVLAINANEIAWAIGLTFGACFWAAGIWYWKEIEG